ncbi:hypothetical protein D770_26535 [Flammeovirgaceae bacterium 311]|nr:hypothetical protein D770_26535 [Flammeovirgaceae bacterium 311]
MKCISSLFLYLAVLLVLSAGCDRLGEDVAPANLDGRAGSGSFEVYTYPGGTAVINIQEWIVAATPSNSSGGRSTFQINMQPEYGNLLMDPRGFLIYQSIKSYSQNTDYLGFNIVQDNQTLANYVVKINISDDTEAFPCEAGAIGDSIFIKTDSQTNQLDLLSNDKICSNAAVLTSVSALPGRGTLSLINNIFNFTPTAGFTGSDSFIYQICQTTTGNGTRCTLGYVFLEISPSGGACIPEAREDQYNLAAYTEDSGEAEYVALPVLENDEICGTASMELRISAPAQTGSTYIENNIIYYRTKKGFVGTDSLSYEICNTTGECSESSVSINLQ